MLFPPVIDVAAGALFDGQRLLVARRGPDEAAPGQWELPGGKVESGESLAQAVVREWEEELSMEVVAGHFRGSWWGVQAWRRYRINVVEVHPTSALPKVMVSQAHDDIRWFGPDDDVDAFTLGLIATSSRPWCLGRDQRSNHVTASPSSWHGRRQVALGRGCVQRDAWQRATNLRVLRLEFRCRTHLRAARARADQR